MRKLLFPVTAILFVVFVCFQGVGHAASFSDNFDDPTYTSNNWIPVFPDWSSIIISGGSDWGYQGTDIGGTDDPAAAAASSGLPYVNAGLTVSVDVKIDSYGGSNIRESYGGIFFGVNDLGSGVYTGYYASIELDYLGTPELALKLTEINGGDLDKDNVSLSFDTFYNLTVVVDSNENMNVDLYDTSSSSSPLASVSAPKSLSGISSGMVGIGGTPISTYNNFSLTGNPVPLPGAVWLLGSGFIGLVGLKKKFRK